MRKMLLVSCLVLSLAVGRTTVAADNPLATQATAILKTYCHRCHGIDFKQPGLDVLDRATLLRPKDSSEKPYLVPKDLKQSRIWEQLDGGDMPPAKQPQPSAAEKATIKKWIEAGAEFPAADRPKREFLGEDSLLKLIASDLERQPATTRRFLRYFSLGHLWNDPALSDSDLRHVRAGVSKLLNSLSWKPRIAVPSMRTRRCSPSTCGTSVGPSGIGPTCSKPAIPTACSVATRLPSGSMN